MGWGCCREFSSFSFCVSLLGPLWRKVRVGKGWDGVAMRIGAYVEGSCTDHAVGIERLDRTGWLGRRREYRWKRRFLHLDEEQQLVL